jgi:hypothetical protein
MSTLLAKIRTEPALLSGALAAVLALAAAFGFKLSADQVGALMAVVTAGLGFVVRSQVTPVVNLPVVAAPVIPAPPPVLPAA